MPKRSMTLLGIMCLIGPMISIGMTKISLPPPKQGGQNGGNPSGQRLLMKTAVDRLSASLGPVRKVVVGQKMVYWRELQGVHGRPRFAKFSIHDGSKENLNP